MNRPFRASPRPFACLFLLSLLAGCAVPVRESGPDQPEAVSIQGPSRFSAAKDGGDLPPGWRVWSLSRFKRRTEYQLVHQDGRTVVRAKADASASGLVHDLNLDANRFPVIRWRWKVQELIPSADNTKRHAEDSPVRLVLTFEGDKNRFDFSDKMFATQLRLMTGVDLPYATLMYIWENRAPVGTLLPNLHTARIKMIVAESGKDRLGQWREETRNIVEDFRRAFGEEPGRLVSVAVLTDTDNTEEQAHAYYGDIQFLPAPRR